MQIWNACLFIYFDDCNSKVETLLTSAADKNETLGSVKFPDATLQQRSSCMRRHDDRRISKACQRSVSLFLKTAHILCRSELTFPNYFSQPVICARCHLVSFSPVSTLRLFRSQLVTLWRHSRQQVCDRAPLPFALSERNVNTADRAFAINIFHYN